MANLAFKNQDGEIYKFNPFSDSGVSGANRVSEGSVNSWNKLNEEAITEAAIGSIDDINNQISELTSLLKKQKEKLKKLINEAGNLKSTQCTGSSSMDPTHSHTCNVPTKLSSYSSAEIEVLEGQIEIINNTIIFLGYLRTYLGFMKANNMYYRIEQ